jgi:micrococcal nuclease
MFEYQCEVIRVVDGDTVDAKIDLGFRIAFETRFRLTGINAPEMNTDAGKRAKQRLAELMPVGARMKVRSEKDRTEKYGRYLGTFIDSDGHDVNSRMVLEGHAVPYLGRQ